jgi:hypothetical protein
MGDVLRSTFAVRRSEDIYACAPHDPQPPDPHAPDPQPPPAPHPLGLSQPPSLPQPP